MLCPASGSPDPCFLHVLTPGFHHGLGLLAIRPQCPRGSGWLTYPSLVPGVVPPGLFSDPAPPLTIP